MWGKLPRNVALLATPPPAVWHEQTALTPEQGRALLAAARGERLEAPYRVAPTLGLRLGEALGLRRVDIDLDAGSLRIAQTVQRIAGELVFGGPKTRHSRRTLPLPETLRRAISAHPARQDAERERAGERWSDWGLVFTTQRGTPLEPRNVVRSVKALIKRAGLPDICFHDLRHSCASLLVAAGHHPRVVMETLGHSQIGITMDADVHVYAGALRAVAETMDALLPGAEPAETEGIA